jgi:hypothetical protein
VSERPTSSLPRRSNLSGVSSASPARGVALLVFVAALCVPTSVAAQSGAGGRWEIGAGGLVTGGFDMGNQPAELTSNAGGTFDQFTTSSKMQSAPGVQGRVGVFLSRAFSIEGGVRWTRPVYSVRITGDTEGGADTRAEETLNSYLFDGTALWHFRDLRSSRATPFVYGGAGYLRELHDGDALVEEGTEFHFGGGVKVWMGGSRRIGLRGEAGLSIRDGGFDFEEKRRAVPLAAGSVFWVF